MVTQDATGFPRGLPLVAFYWMKNQGLGELRKRASTSRIVSVIILIYLSIDLLAKHDDFHLFRWLGSNMVKCKVWQTMYAIASPLMGVGNSRQT